MNPTVESSSNQSEPKPLNYTRLAMNNESGIQDLSSLGRLLPDQQPRDQLRNTQNLLLHLLQPNGPNSQESLNIANSIIGREMQSQTSDNNYTWKQYEARTAMNQITQLAAAGFFSNGQHGSEQNLNPLALVLYLALTGNDPIGPNVFNNIHSLNVALPHESVNMAGSQLVDHIGGNIQRHSQTYIQHPENEPPYSTYASSESSRTSTVDSPSTYRHDSPYSSQFNGTAQMSDLKSNSSKIQQPTSSKLLAKLSFVTERPDIHITATTLDNRMIEFLEALYPINNSPDPAAIDMIAKRMNVVPTCVADWFSVNRRLANPMASGEPKSPPAKRRAGGRVVTFSEYQRSLLEHIFNENNYLHPQEYEQLSKLIVVPSRNIKIWFKNRRSKKRLSDRR